ncbi:MAG TPA: MBOAT family protein [Terriglobales bacterium]|nr:MBOAT family protein [Terriglobales bacterium]
MLFNSLTFLVFLPIVWLTMRALPVRWKNPFLLAASYFFYGCWDWRFLALLFGTTVIDFWVGKKLGEIDDPSRRKRILWLSLGANLGVLGFFKYFNFFVDSAAGALAALGFVPNTPLLEIILPVGISFYTFQSMSYTIDIYRRRTEPARRFEDFALYVAYFPQLVAGPISRADDLMPQLVRPAPITFASINTGLMLIFLGLFKKVLIADMLAPEVDRIFTHPDAMSAGVLLRGAYFFTFQIYCDFSGYSDMARGVSRLFGAELVINFNQPYLSQSITEFWRRWHISLSHWLRDYLYIPLGGNRFGPWKTYRNLMLTMLIGGLWHGANWTYVVWGGLHGLYLAAERMLGIGADVGGGWLRRAAGGVVTFHLVALAWIFFRAPNFSVAFEYIRGILAFDNLAAVGPIPFLVAAVVMALDIPQNLSNDHTVFVRARWWMQAPVYAVLCFGILLYGGREIPFIYFQF